MECLRCGANMKSIGVEQLKLGEAGFITGSWSGTESGGLEVEIKICAKCGKVEFFASELEEFVEEAECPHCHNMVDCEADVCPSCGRKLYREV